MTSRPSAGIPRPPQRSLSGTGSIQRPTPNRALSQQYQTSSSPVRKTDSFVDLTLEGSETALGRYGPASRISGSRLKLEISKDISKADTPSLDSPKPIEVPSEPQPAPLIRGRPKLYFGGDARQLQGTGDGPLLSSVRGSENITRNTPLPMPRRPGQTAPLARMEKISTTHTAVKKDARPKPYVLETPSVAPHYPPNGHADFFPWMGNHPEDHFTDHVIRQGYFDKSQTTQNETGSAKMSIFPALKQKTGLQTLSSLFTNVFAQRRTHGQITSAPTFKPPPRVTLTDTKRETWLRDLANPSISLRRLSRTIPHGIRGKILLEQCLSKKIPTERAVWLAKCVGANEIRAFKRKGVTGTFGMGGEAKWIRDWTIFVEQFVESIINSCGEKDWKDRVLYAVRLAAHLYSEHLLDREHFLDWLSASLESCPLAKAPMWLLITQVYWKDLLKARKYGRRLVAALCAHLQAVHDIPDGDLLLPLLERLLLLLNTLMETYPESFVSPKTWEKYRRILQLYICPDPNKPSMTYLSIDNRNNKLASNENPSAQTESHQIVRLLDKSLLHLYSPEIPQECWRLTSDRPLLVRTVLEWASSSHRPGIAKVYVGARILRIWSRYGVDLNDEILSFLGSESDKLGLDREDLYHLISELSRSKHFSTSKYIQWLIARGGIRGTTDLAKGGPPSTRLLAELPIHDIPESIDRLRCTLLSRAQLAVEDEIELLEGQIDIMKASLPEMIHPNGTALGQQPEHSIPGDNSNIKLDLSRTIKSEIGLWLRNLVSSHMAFSKTSPSTWKSEVATSVTLSITTESFMFVRHALESIQDISMLADVLQVVTSSDNVYVLASCADTLSFNLHAFAAIGALKDLFESLLSRMRSLSELQDFDVIVLLRSLSSLAARLPGGESVAFQLSQELAQSSRRSAADACSPVSDYMAEVLQNSESEFSDEIEKALASGTSMDQHTLGSFFDMIISRMEATWYKSPQQQRNSALLLMQLRSFGGKQFGSLMSGWLRQAMETSSRPPLGYILGPLIAIGCVDFEEVLNTSASVLDSIGASVNGPMPSKIAFETLSLLIGGPNDTDFMSTDDAYHLAILRLHAQQDLPKVTLDVLRRAIELCAPSMQNEHEALVILCQNQQMQDFLQTLVLVDFDIVAQKLTRPLIKSSDPEVSAILTEIIRHLLYPEASNQFNDHQTVASRIESALRSADHLTLPFCQLELQAIFATEKQCGLDDERDSSDCREAFERAVDLAVANKNWTWTSIIRTLDIQIARNLCRRAEDLFLSLTPTANARDPETTRIDNYEQAARFLVVVKATSYSMETSSTQQVATRIVEKLADIWQVAAQGDAQQDTLNTWLPLMLDFITLHISKFDLSKSSSEIRARMLLSLSSLILELQRHGSHISLLGHLFDVAILLVDDLPEDIRQSCVRVLKDKTADARIHYIFGYSSMPMDWLQLGQKGKLVPYPLRRWEILSEPTPNVGENDTSLSLTLFQARKV